MSDRRDARRDSRSATDPAPTADRAADGAGKRGFFPQFSPSVHGGVDVAELGARAIDPGTIADFSSNQTPLGISPAARAAVAGAVLDAYPDRDTTSLAAALAQRHRVDPGQVVIGNGSTELIRLVAQLVLREGDVALSLAPSFGEYQLATQLARSRFVEHCLAQDADPPDPDSGSVVPHPVAPVACRSTTGFAFDRDAFTAALSEHRPRLCWLCSPNNPTGAAVPPAHITALVEDHSDTLFVLDEAYCDLLAVPQWTPDLLRAGNLLVLRSMTKAWGFAGLRLGYAIADERLAGPLRAAKPPWNVNACAQVAGLAALADEAWYRRSVDVLRDGRDNLTVGLVGQGWDVLASTAGFFLIDVGDAAAARERLLARGCLVRDCASFGLPEYVRVSPRHADENALLLRAFAQLEQPRRGPGD